MTPDLSSPVSVAKQCAQAALPVMDIVKRHVSRMLQAFGGVQNPLLHMGEEGFKDIVTLSETMRTLFNSTREVMECQEHSKESLEMVKAERQAALQAEVEENCKFLDMSTERDDSSAPPLPSPAVLSRFLEKAGRFSEHDDDDEDEDGHLRVIIELNKDDDLGLKELFGVADEPSSTSAAAAAGASSSSSADVIVLDGGEGQGQGNRATEAAEVELKGAKKPQVSLDKDAESRAALEKALGLDELPEVTQQSPEPAFVLETSFDGLEYPEQVPYTPDQRLALHSSIANGCVTLVAKFATDLHANRLRGHGAERRTKTLQDRWYESTGTTRKPRPLVRIQGVEYDNTLAFMRGSVMHEKDQESQMGHEQSVFTGLHLCVCVCVSCVCVCVCVCFCVCQSLAHHNWKRVSVLVGAAEGRGVSSVCLCLCVSSVCLALSMTQEAHLFGQSGYILTRELRICDM